MNEGNYANTSCQTQISLLKWILDLGASRHVTCASREFASYTQYLPHAKKLYKQRMVHLNLLKVLALYNALQVLNYFQSCMRQLFPVNLISISALVDQLDCRVMLDWESCSIQERRIGRRLGTTTRRSRLWYIDREGAENALCSVLAATMEGKEASIMLLHCRMGHLSFD
jgi:hypothetical protein